MKFIVVVGIVSFAAAVIGELCQSPDECVVTYCDNNATVICERGECTCLEVATAAPTGEVTCASITDCMGLAHCHGDGTHGPPSQHGHEWHCVDGVCRCAGWHP